MSEEPHTSRQAAGSRIRAGIRQLSLGRSGSMVGTAEIIGLVGSAVILLVAIVSYIYFLAPARSNLVSLQLERSRLQNQVRSSREVLQGGRSTEETVVLITQSLDDFESQRLISRSEGRMELYGVLNNLIKKNALRNTSGPTYTSLEVAGSANASSKSASSKWQSVYPGIAINLTVEGQYQNLRRFIQDLEVSKQFIVINGVELEKATETRSIPTEEGTGKPAPPSQVSLRLDMATYFQRNGGEGTGRTEATR